MSDALQFVAQAADSLADAERALLDAVAGARADGATWQQVADVLGVSRQAAFKRFGRAVDPVSGEQLVPAPVMDIESLAGQVFDHLAAGDADWVRSRMTQTCSRALTRRVLEEVWRDVLASCGSLERMVTSSHDTEGTPLAGPEVPLPAVARVELLHEAGECWAHVALNRDGRITGIVIRPGDLPESWPL